MTGILSGRRILVVEDEMLVLMSIETMLHDLGCTAISAAATVAAALALLEEERFDLAMLDVNLAGETSDRVADALLARGIPFAVSTGYSDHGEHIETPGRPVLRKPYVTAKLAAVLAPMVSGAPLPATASPLVRKSGVTPDRRQ